MSDVAIMPLGGWLFYVSEEAKTLNREKCGKWMYFFDDRDFAAKICNDAVNTNVCVEAKHSDDANGVCCFYLNGDDIAAHKRVIQFFLDNNLIKRTKNGKLYNISFKYDNQTRNGEYGEDFVGSIKLEDFIDLNTGSWKE